VARCDPTPVLDAPRTQIDPAFAGPIGEERLLFCPRDLGGKPRAVKRRLTPDRSLRAAAQPQTAADRA